MATTVDRSKVRDYLKFRAVSSKRERVAVWILIPVVLVVVLMFWGIPPLNIIPVWGPSMQPTLAVWSVPAPFERWSFSGWVCYDSDKKPEIGNIVCFRIPDTRVYEVKRVAKIGDRGQLWVTPDNSGVSGEGSDNSELYKWVETDWVIGVVDSAFTPIRMLRWFTEEGRFRNWVETNLLPCTVDCGLQLPKGRRFLSAGSYWAITSPDRTITRFMGEAQISEDRQSVLSVDRDKGTACVVGMDNLKSGPEVCIGEQLYGIVQSVGKFYVLGEDDNIWQISPVSAKIIAPLPRGCNALSLRRDGQIVAGWQDEISPPASSNDWRVVYVAR